MQKLTNLKIERKSFTIFFQKVSKIKSVKWDPLVHTRLKTFPKFVDNSAGHFMWNGSNFFTNRILKLFNTLREITVVYPEKKIARI